MIIKKYAGIISLILVTVFVLVGCGKNKNAEEVNQAQEQPAQEIENLNTEQEAQLVEVAKEETVATETVASTKTTEAKTEKKEEDKKQEKSKKEKTSKDTDNNNDEEKPNACIEISGKQYNENTYYLGVVKLDASCSKNSEKYQWFINGKIVGSNKTYSVSLSNLHGGLAGAKEIKLVATSKDGLSNSETKTINFRKIPELKACFNQDSATVKSFKLEQEYEFNASCTTVDEISITKYSWEFQESDNGEKIKKDGIKVSHSFSNKATKIKVTLNINTNAGASYSYDHTYAVEK